MCGENIRKKHFFVQTKNGPLFPLLYYSLILLIIHKNHNRWEEIIHPTILWENIISFLHWLATDGGGSGWAVSVLMQSYEFPGKSDFTKAYFYELEQNNVFIWAKKTYNSLMLVENGLNPQWTQRREHYIE
jgi:hypothetical protein